MKNKIFILVVFSVITSLATFLAFIDDTKAFDIVENPTEVEKYGGSETITTSGSSEDIQVNSYFTYNESHTSWFYQWYDWSIDFKFHIRFGTWFITSDAITVAWGSYSYGGGGVPYAMPVCQNIPSFSGWDRYVCKNKLFAFKLNSNGIVDSRSWNLSPENYGIFVAGNMLISYYTSHLHYFSLDYDTGESSEFQSLTPPMVLNPPSSWTNLWGLWYDSENTTFSPPATDTVPVYVPEGAGFFFYQATNGKKYRISAYMNGLYASDYPNNVKISPLLFNKDNSYVFTTFPSDTSASGSVTFQYWFGSGTGWTAKSGFSSGSVFDQLTAFSNPYLFFKKGTDVYKYDMRCDNPDYTSCRVDFQDSKKYCSNDNYDFDPRHILCGSPFSQTISSGSGGSSNGWGNSIGTGSYTAGTWTYTSTPVSQDCTPVSFSGVTEITGSGMGDPGTCSWKTINSIFRCQDTLGNQCQSNGDACLTLYTSGALASFSGTTNYTGDVTKYNCSVPNYSCSWINKDSCWPASYCETVGNYCKVKPDYVPEIFSFSWIAADPGTSLIDASWFWNWTWSLSMTSGTWYNSIVYDTIPGTCKMFWTWWEFLYSSNASYSLNFNLMTFSSDSIVQSVLYLPQKLIDSAMVPINDLLTLYKVITPIPDNSQVCFLWMVQDIKYQRYVIFSGSTNSTNFHSLDSYKPIPWKMNFLDYIVLFFVWWAFLILMVSFLIPSSK